VSQIPLSRVLPFGLLIQSYFFAHIAGVSKYHTEVEDGNSTCAIRGYGSDVVQGSQAFYSNYQQSCSILVANMDAV
jgi:hypothetical protein